MTCHPPETEDRLLTWLRGQDPQLAATIGDDAAFLPEAGPRAVTVDSQIEGVHFLPDLPPEVLARRLLAVNLSDLAAVGARPGPAFLALSAPAAFDRRRFFTAFLSACRAHGVRLSGGDLATAQQVTLTLTLLGDLEAGSRWLRRDAARAGQELWIGGALGESALGRHLLAAGVRLTDGELSLPRTLRLPRELHPAAKAAVSKHLEPEPQLELGRWLARRPHIGAAIDLSDGLGKDLRRLCTASDAGARIDRRALEASEPMRRLAALLGLQMESLAVGGGEDYVLLFTLPPGESPPARWSCRRAGCVTKEKDILWGETDRWSALPDAGWDHLTGDFR